MTPKRSGLRKADQKEHVEHILLYNFITIEIQRCSRLNEMKKFKRSRYIVNKRVQYSMGLVLISYFIVILLVVGIALFGPLFFSLNNKEMSLDVKSIIADQILYMHLYFWPAFIFVSCILVIHSILVSHRMAGPLYRFGLFFKKIREGDVSETISIRKHDYLHPEKDMMNEMIISIRNRIDVLKTEHKKAEDLLYEIQENGDIDKNDAMRKRLAELQKHLNSVSKELAHFKTN